MKNVGSIVLTLVGLAFLGLAVVALNAARGPCTTNCSVFPENAKMYKGYAAAAGAVGLSSLSFVGLLNLDQVRRPSPPYRTEDRP